MSEREVVRPTADDPLLRGTSAMLGGPAGEHAGHHRWWTPVRVLLVLTAVCFALGMVQKTGCYASDWQNGEERYAQMCYSDLPYLYTDRGFAELEWPYSSDPQVRARYQVMEYPAGISYFAWATAEVTHVVVGRPDLSARAQVPESELYGRADVQREIRWFVSLSALAFAVCALASTWLLAGVTRRRPWDAAAFAASPTLLLTGLVNWDLLAVVTVCAALWAWSRDRPVLTGVMIGLGTAIKLYPLFLLGGILVICVRRRRLPDLGQAVVAAALAWAVVDAPAYVTGPEQWKVFWSFNSHRLSDLGSLWLLLADTTHTAFTAHTINTVSWAFFGAWCCGVLAISLRAPVTPRLAQLGYLVVVGFLLVNKVYSPQYVLWLLPLAVLARPRWRDQLIWQSTEVFYFCCVWWYLAGYLNPAGTGGQPGVYWIATVLRMLGELYLAAVIVRDLHRPEHDPVLQGADPPDPGVGEDYENTTSSTSVAV